YADRQAEFLAARPVVFTQEAVNPPTTVTFDQTAITATDTLTLPGHGLITGESVVYHKLSGADFGLTEGTTYFVTRVDDNAIRLAGTRGGTPITTLTVGAGTGAYTLTAQVNPQLTIPGHDFQTGQAVVFTILNATPAPLNAPGGAAALVTNTIYYVIRIDANT